MTQRRTLVTGASGFLGAALVRRLVAAGEPLCLLTRQGREDAAAAVATAAGAADGQATVRGVRWDDPRTVADAVTDLEIPAVHHLAGGRTLGLSGDALGANSHSNLRPLETLIGALAARPPGVFVYVSSGEVYGAQTAPFREEQPARPVTAYGSAKVAAEALGLMAHRQSGFPFVVARPALVYGPGQPPVMFVPQLIEGLLAAATFPMSPGEQLRDLVYVDDVAEALAALAAPGLEGEVFNIGTGTGVRLRDLAEEVRRGIPGGGVPVPGALPYREGEIMDYRLSGERLTTRTGWRPATSLSEGLRRTIAAAVEAHRTTLPRHG
jgi:UDP-glucose 4-epimerase